MQFYLDDQQTIQFLKGEGKNIKNISAYIFFQNYFPPLSGMILISNLKNDISIVSLGPQNVENWYIYHSILFHFFTIYRL